MNKKIQAYIKLQVCAGMANPAPPVGPALGQKGVNIMEFCKKFNDKTKNFEKGLPIPVLVTVYSDRSFSFITKTPPASILLKKAAGIKVGSSKPGKENIGNITNEQIYEIAKSKAVDMSGSNLEAMSNSIKGTARSIGILIKD